MKKLILAFVLILAAASGFYGEATANMQCGFKPIPNIGCYIGYCICDSDGCYWQQICN